MTKLLIFVALMALGYYFLKPKAKTTTKTLPDVDEARAVLGIGPDADADTVRAAHRRLLAGVHPDRGGSADLTRRVNAARDVLLRRLGE